MEQSRLGNRRSADGRPAGSKPGMWFLGAVVAALVILRFVLLADAVSSNPLVKVPLVDAALHHEQAVEIAGGRLVGDGPFDRPPLYSWFLAAVYALGGPSPVAAVLVQTLLGLAGLWLLYRLAHIHAGAGGALVALCLAGLYGPLAFFETKLLPASLSVVIVLALLNLLAFRPGKEAWWRFAAAGLAGGLLVLDRPNMIFLPLLLIGWLFLSRSVGARRGAALFLAGAIVGILPAFVHNAAAGDGSVPVCSGGGLNFYLGNRQGAEVSFSAGGEELGDGTLFTDPGGMAAASESFFARAKGRPPESGAELERFWIGRGLDEIFSDPVGWLKLEGLKLKALLSAYEYGVNCSYEAERAIVSTLSFFVVPFWLLAALGAAGLALRRDRPREPDAPSRVPESPSRVPDSPSRAPLVLVLVAVALSTLVFFTYSRFRLPAVPVLALLGGDVLARAVGAFRPARALVPLAAGIAASALALLPPGDLARHQTAGGHALVGAAFFRMGEVDESSAAYARAVETDPGATRAIQTWASVLFSAGRFDAARARHEEALAAAPDDVDVLVNAALFFATAPSGFCDTGRALDLAARAKTIEPENALVPFCQAVTLRLEGRAAESEAKVVEAIARSGRAPRMLRMIAAWYREQQMAVEAEALEAEALEAEAAAREKTSPVQ